MGIPELLIVRALRVGSDSTLARIVRVACRPSLYHVASAALVERRSNGRRDLCMLNIVLVEPEIPQNTGNIARTCACIGARLHLVEPMGFRPTERNLKRAGCDYWDDVEIVRWSCAGAFFEAHGEDDLHLFTGAVERGFADVAYADECFLVFGRESRGLAPEVIEAHRDRCVRIPMLAERRSLNLSNAVAIASYEALRQLGYPHLV